MSSALRKMPVQAVESLGNHLAKNTLCGSYLCAVVDAHSDQATGQIAMSLDENGDAIEQAPINDVSPCSSIQLSRNPLMHRTGRRLLCTARLLYTMQPRYDPRVGHFGLQLRLDPTRVTRGDRVTRRVVRPTLSTQV